MLTTLLRPTRGEVRVLGLDPCGHPETIKRQMGVVPQENNLDEELNVIQNLMIYSKFYGLPGGTEFPSFVESITDISRGETLLSPESAKALRKLKEDVSVRVFVTPT